MRGSMVVCITNVYNINELKHKVIKMSFSSFFIYLIRGPPSLSELTRYET